MCAVFILSGCVTDLFIEPLEAQSAHLDLGDWDFSEHPMVQLEGEWDFYWQELYHDDNSLPLPDETVRIPSFWREYQSTPADAFFGYCSYRCVITLPDRDEVYAFILPEMGNSYNLFINGELFASNGRVGVDRESTIPQWEPRLRIFAPEQRQIELVLEVANFHHMKGGIFYPIQFGRALPLIQYQRWNTGVRLLIFGGLIIAAIYHFFLYLIRKQNKSSLYFAGLCVIIGIRALLVGEYLINYMIPFLPWTLLVKIEYLTIYLTLPIEFLYTAFMFPKETWKPLKQVFSGVGIVISAVIIITPPIIFTFVNNVSLVAFALAQVYVLIILISAASKQRPGGLTALIGFILLLFTVINDILHGSNIIVTGNYSHIGTFIFVISQGIILSQKFAIAFDKNEQLSKDLQKHTRKLELVNMQLERMNRVKDDFLAQTSHEFKTPLHGIIGMSEVLLSQDEGLSETQRRDVELIYASGKRLSYLINDILDLSKLKYKDIILNRRPIYLHAVVDVVIELSRTIYMGSEVIIRNNISEDLPPVFADEGRIQQVVQNLLSNAMKHTTRGSVTFTAEKVSGQVIVKIADTGPGIPEDQLQTIFNAYEQIEKGVPDERVSGTGLGLAICKKLIELHGGNIWAENNEGAVFSFSLPAYAGSMPREKSQEQETALSGTLSPVAESKSDKTKIVSTIAIIDDEPLNLQLLTNILQQERYMVVSFQNSVDASVEIPRRKDIDVVISDVMMPGLNGYELCRELRKGASMYELPILLLTIKNQPEDVVTGLESGANDFLTKPFDSRELKERVRTLVKLKRLTMANARLTEANAVNQWMMQLITHDLRSPLSGISGAAEVLEQNQDLSVESERLLKSIRVSSEHLITLVNKMAEFIKMENGTIVPEKTQLDINVVCTDTVERLRAQAKKKDQKIVLIPDYEHSAEVRADHIRSVEVIDNIINNAIKYSPHGSVVTVQIDGQDETYVSVQVSDQGPGIKSEEREKLFKKYSVLSAKPTGDEKSLGLGLSLAAEIMWKQDGYISIDPDYIAGTRFVIHFKK